MRSSGWIVLAIVAVVGCALLLGAVLRPLGGGQTQEQQMLQIAADLRCPVCAGESAAAANTTQAQAMRAQIATDLAAGMRRPQILQQFTSEYGTWILYRPPARGAYLLLWLVPLVALGGLATGLARVWGAGRRLPAGPSLPDSSPTPEAPLPPEVARRLGRFL